MNITIKNCNNIDLGSITIDLAKLNIKYAMNGMGKSTVARAIELNANTAGTLSDLTQFKHIGESNPSVLPSIEGATEIRSVLVFNVPFGDG